MACMKILYLPIEPYPERYTEMLGGWTHMRWAQAPGVSLFMSVYGEKLGAGINVGQVLDAYGRSHWSATQVAALVRVLRDVQMTADDVIYFDDLFAPGYEAVPYILAQLPAQARPRVFARSWAQSVDPHDFTFPMRAWMRPYEQMVHATAAGVFCGSTVHAQMMQVAMLDACPVHVVGLPHDEADVRARGPAEVLALEQRPLKVVFTSRLDAEKNPHFMMDVVEATLRINPGVEFVVCTGAKAARSNHPTAIARLHLLQRDGKVRVAAALTKTAYYDELASARVQLNTASQDFVSFTAIEASTFGTPTLAPAFCSFPETLRNQSANLFAPWCVDEAVRKLLRLLSLDDRAPDVGWLSRVSNRTLDRTLSVMQGGTVQPWASEP